MIRPREEPGPQRRAHRATLAHHAIMICCGLAGLALDPSPSVSAVLGGGPGGWIVTTLWSAVFIVAGLIGLTSRLARSVRAELWCMWMLSITLIIWAVIIVAAVYLDYPPAAGGPVQFGSIQTALALVASGCTHAAWAWWATSLVRTGQVAPLTDAERAQIAQDYIRDLGGLRSEEI